MSMARNGYSDCAAGPWEHFYLVTRADHMNGSKGFLAVAAIAGLVACGGNRTANSDSTGAISDSAGMSQSGTAGTNTMSGGSGVTGGTGTSGTSTAGTGGAGTTTTNAGSTSTSGTMGTTGTTGTSATGTRTDSTRRTNPRP